MNKIDTNNEPQGWNAKVDIADQVVPILNSYKRIILSEDSYSIPTWVDEEESGLTEDELKKRWLSYVDSMIFAFSLEISGKVPSKEDRATQKRGLELFSKYYIHLWD